MYIYIYILVVGETHLMKTVPYKRKPRNRSTVLFSFKIYRNVVSLEISRNIFLLSKTVLFLSKSLDKCLFSFEKCFSTRTLSASFSSFDLFFHSKSLEKCFLSKYLVSFISRSAFAFDVSRVLVFYL